MCTNDYSRATQKNVARFLHHIWQGNKKNIMFKKIGYSRDYIQDGKYIGSIKIDKPDREVFGFLGRKKHVAESNIKFKKKTIKKGSIYVTELQVLCGKLKDKVVK